MLQNHNHKKANKYKKFQLNFMMNQAEVVKRYNTCLHTYVIIAILAIFKN